MPFTETVSSNYVGKEAGRIAGDAFQEADTIRLGLVTFAENVNYLLNMRRIEYTNGKQVYSCGFDPNGGIVLDERVLTTIKVKNDIQVCKETFRATWSESQLGASAKNSAGAFAGSDIMQAIQVEVLADTAEDTDRVIWQGDNGTNPEEWDGFETLFVADASVIKPTGPSGIGALSESTVEQHLKIALAAIPRALRRKSVEVLVAPDVFQAYWFYLVSKGIANDGNTDAKRVGFGKYMLTEVNGLSDGKVVIYEKRNLVFATGLLGDHNEFMMRDEDTIGLLSGFVRGKMVYNGGCQYYKSDEIVYYDAVAVV